VYKFTIGLWAMATGVLLRKLWPDELPIWLVMVLALVPLLVFMIVHPDFFPNRIVGFAHIAASLWYFAVTICLLTAMAGKDKPLAWLVLYLIFATIGGVPCGIVLYRWVQDKYPPPTKGPGDDAE
jgi:hypothetical protein